MQLFSLFLVSILSLSLHAQVGDKVDCSAAYYELNSRVTCEVVRCPEEYERFIGSWEGPFTTVDKTSGLKREYRNQVTYSTDDCLRNIDQKHSNLGDTLIIGRQIDIYPPLINEGKVISPDKIELGLLITGRNFAGNPFLRTVNTSDKRNDYTLIRKEETTVTSIWSLFQKNGYCNEKGSCYDIRILTNDGKDMSYTQGHKRNVKITLEAYVPGTGNKVFETELVSGFHILRK
jgi:hypothetical protein